MSTIKHDMTAVQVIKWIEDHVFAIRQLVAHPNEPDQFEVTWLDKHDQQHVSRCQNLTALAKHYHDL